MSLSLKISDIFKATFLVKCIAASDNVTLEGVKAFAILTLPEVFSSFLFLNQLYTSRLKCLKAWHEYADSKRIQEDMKLLADKHRRLTLLKGRFQKWKKRVCCLFASREFFCGMTVNSIMFIIFQCTSKKKLQALIGQWQKKAFGKWHSLVKKKKKILKKLAIMERL